MRPPLVALAVLFAACGAPPPPEAPPAAGSLPATDRDPLPYTPAPTAEGRAGETVALAASGGEDQARRMLPDLLRAVRDADERQLESLFADEVVPIVDRRRGGARLRSEIVQRILVYARRSVIPSDAEPDDLVELPQVAIRRASQFFRGEDMPEQVRPTDLVVEVPIRDAARGPLHTVLGWRDAGHLVVRPGRDPRIVAL